jgi:hypothetical protein
VPQKAGIKMTPQMSRDGTGDSEFAFAPRSVSDEEVAKIRRELDLDKRTGVPSNPQSGSIPVAS